MFLIIVGVIFLIFLIGDLLDAGDDCDYSSSTNTTLYENEDFWGVYRGKSDMTTNGRVEHKDCWGNTTSYSERHGDKIQHKTWYGTHDGYSVDKGDKLDHFNEMGVWQGSSTRNSDGSYTHRDIFGNETGRSKKK